MRVRLTLADGRSLVVDDATLMVVEDDAGNPVSVAGVLGIGRAFVVSSIDDDRRFSKVLRELGVRRISTPHPVRLTPGRQLPAIP